MNKEKELEEIISYYEKQKNPADQENIKAMLSEVQELIGWIPKDFLEQVSERMKVKMGVLECMIRFSSELKSAPYKHTVTLCTGARCGSKNSMEILQRIKNELGVSKDGLSENQVFYLRTQNCLKQCGTSLNMLVDEKIYRNLNPELAVSILRSL